ncbi:MAG: tetratricopeptide repeat protein [Acidobacteria bacterium]|nr:tetratricopeptide repeat protein [Acidobacteriota bacterium]MDW7984920.1 tetratricopeptide repeat protein [Acidobacteriota bacterium]
MQDIERLHRRYLLDPRPMNLVRWLDALFQADRFEDVVRAAEAETARFPDYAPLRIVLARAYMALGRWDLARSHLQEVLRRDATHLRAWETLLEVYASQDRWDDVATCLENLEMLGWEAEKLRLWKERLAEHRPPIAAIYEETPQEIPLRALSPTPPAPESRFLSPPSTGPESSESPVDSDSGSRVSPLQEAQEAGPPAWVLAGLGWATWADAWTAAQPAGPFFRRQRPRARGVSPKDLAWYNLIVYWDYLGPKGRAKES